MQKISDSHVFEIEHLNLAIDKDNSQIKTSFQALGFRDEGGGVVLYRYQIWKDAVRQEFIAHQSKSKSKVRSNH